MADEAEPTQATSQSEDDRDREELLWRLGWITRDLAANMLRVMRGAGKPHELAEAMLAFNRAIMNGPKVRAFEVSEAMREALGHGLAGTDGTELDRAVHDMERAAARMIAGRLLAQQLQVVRGHNDFFEALRDAERIREENRKRYMPRPEEVRLAIKTNRVRRIAAAPRAAAKPSPPVEEDIDPNAWKTTADYMRLRRAQLKRLRSGDAD